MEITSRSERIAERPPSILGHDRLHLGCECERELAARVVQDGLLGRVLVGRHPSVQPHTERRPHVVEERVPLAVPIPLADQTLHLLTRELQRTGLVGRGELMPVADDIHEGELHGQDTILPCTARSAHGHDASLLRFDLVRVELLDLVQLVQHLRAVVCAHDLLSRRDHVVEVLRKLGEL